MGRADLDWANAYLSSLFFFSESTRVLAAQDAEAELMSRHENDRGGAAGKAHRVEVESDSDCDGA